MSTPISQPQYDNLDDLLAAVKSGEVTNVTMTLDNDSVSASARPRGGNEAHIVFEEHPATLIREALTALGFETEEV
jgi:hypothetical protein